LRKNNIHPNYVKTDGPFYVGTGSLDAPIGVRRFIERAAKALAQKGYTLRSGHYTGCEETFELNAGGQADIYIPYGNFRSNTIIKGNPILCDHSTKNSAVVLARSDLANLFDWHKSNSMPPNSVVNLYIRSAMLVIGYESTPIFPEFVVLWEKPLRNNIDGPTNYTYQVAKHYKIPIYNLWNFDEEDQFEADFLSF